MRHIDADKIELKGIPLYDESLDILIPLSDVRKAIQMTPIANVVEVVICKNCRHYHKEKGGWCERHGYEFDIGDYCCHGERRNQK